MGQPQPPSRDDISRSEPIVAPPDVEDIPPRVVRATFDVPFTCKFTHRDGMNTKPTYPVPPVTTLKGLTHAALEHPSRRQLNIEGGDEYSEATDRQTQFNKLTRWGIRNEGGRDGELFPVSEHLSRRFKGESSGYLSQPVTEEVLIEPTYIIYIGAPESVAVEIATAFRDPPYPLMLGDSDSPVDIRDIEVCEPSVVQEQGEVECVVPGVQDIEQACVLPMEPEPQPEWPRQSPIPAPAEPVTVTGGQVGGWVEIESSVDLERFVFID